ncbi:hypothetical protein HHL23_20150 [Chryseobacterium sp. RP-3-3]|uniref:Uncharacterized protein n=1 Tax=Chryseobacterium antibioticum TaxID=2728847 RepID=A0A7Y0ARF5_9FLAO|nr:hypothetical protein [Chryseobacterium antibioticum]NML72083.1 hypothetical protein [Chryseobacterium antibioticum]
MNYIDKETIPRCKIEDKEFEWGEPYKIYTPIFYFIDLSSSKLENSIKLFGENNFKQQLLLMYNVINNYEEFEKLVNYGGEEFNRKIILELINSYMKENENIIAPWEKYDIGLIENDYMKYIEEKLGETLYYVKMEQV